MVGSEWLIMVIECYWSCLVWIQTPTKSWSFWAIVGVHNWRLTATSSVVRWLRPHPVYNPPTSIAGYLWDRILFHCYVWLPRGIVNHDQPLLVINGSCCFSKHVWKHGPTKTTTSIWPNQPALEDCSYLGYNFCARFPHHTASTLWLVPISLVDPAVKATPTFSMLIFYQHSWVEKL